jgi:hypothetical protein
MCSYLNHIQALHKQFDLFCTKSKNTYGYICNFIYFVHFWYIFTLFQCLQTILVMLSLL